MKFYFYLPNRPDFKGFKTVKEMSNKNQGLVPSVIEETGNHWRKIFSIMSKILFSFNSEPSKTWQEYRDKILLTNEDVTLVFDCKLRQDRKAIHIVTGLDCAKKVKLDLDSFEKVDKEARVLRKGALYFTPYFDYRQLPNELLDKLVKDIRKNV